MLPSLSHRCCRITASLVASAIFAPSLLAAQQDGPAVDPAQLLTALHALREQQNTQIKAQKTGLVQQANSAASSTEKAVALWLDAVRVTQFEGAARESTQFMAWKNSEGEAFKDHVIQNALHLYFTWLSLTLQRSAGAKVKDLLPAVINYTKELSSDQLAIEAIEDAQKKEKDMNAGKAPARGPKPRTAADPNIKKVHDSILRRALGASVYIESLKASEYVDVEKWEAVPGSFDGIYKNIILPEMRLQKDPRLMDYWAMMLQKAADEANRSRLQFDVDKYNNIQAPALLWGKFQDMIVLGQKNTALTQMFDLIKKFPAHPDTADWISQLEGLLAPTPPPAPVTTSAPSDPAVAPAPAPGAGDPANGGQPPAGAIAPR